MNKKNGKEPHRAAIREQVVDWVTEEMESGATLTDAAGHVVSRVIKERKGATFLMECGTVAVMDIWRADNAQQRHAAQRPGVRRVALGALQDKGSILESLHSVGDDWVRVGDMDRAMCREVQASFNKQAEGNLQQAQFFSRIADKLKDGQTVREVFTDDQLLSFVQEVRVE